MPYYVVLKGHAPGVYDSWNDCQRQVLGYPGNSYRKFDAKEDAVDFFESGGVYPRWSRSYISLKHISVPSYDRGTILHGQAYFIDQDNRYTVWVDGSCINNGAPDASAGIGVFWGHGHQKNISKRLVGRQTNVRAEIMAAIVAIETAKELGMTAVRMYTDSQYLIDCVYIWIPSWRFNFWRTKDGYEVKNKDLLELLYETKRGISIRFSYVAAHSGDEGNEGADQLAKLGAYKPYPIL